MAGDFPMELVHQAGLPDAGLAHQGDDLSLTALRLGQPVDQVPQVGLAPHEARRARRDVGVAAEPVRQQHEARRGGGRGQLEPPGEERRRVAADDGRAGLGEVQERVQDGAGRPSGVGIELENLGMAQLGRQPASAKPRPHIDIRP